MFFLISTHFTATPGIPLPSSAFKNDSFKGRPGVELLVFTFDLSSHLRALYPMIPDNARPPRLTAAAGTELAGAFSGGTVKTGNCSYPVCSSLLTEVYAPRSFIPHTASLRQAFAHCAIFPTAASRRSLARVSVPVWPATLLGRLPIVALVGLYPTN